MKDWLIKGLNFPFIHEGYVSRLSSEHITICEIEIIYEEITRISLVIEVRSQMAHHIIQILALQASKGRAVALINDVLSEILF